MTVRTAEATSALQLIKQIYSDFTYCIVGNGLDRSDEIHQTLRKGQDPYLQSFFKLISQRKNVVILNASEGS